MLSVRIDGREVETTPVSLARLVFDGRVDRHSPSKAPGTTGERSLEQSLELPHCEALSDELLHRLWAMYAPDSQAGPGGGPVDMQELCDQVERLCRWHWPSPHIASRFLWAAAWLNDLMDRLEIAAGFYDTFLQTSSRGEYLRLLAYNNRGVLRIRLGRLEGVQDLARAAIPESGTIGMEDGRLGVDPSLAAKQPAGLPAACFNLLNLINVSLETNHLVQVVDQELADFFSLLPEDSRTLWLGRDLPGESQEPRGWPGSAEDRGEDFAILRDPTCRRLNMLTACLALQAKQLAGGDAAGGPGSTAAKSSVREPLSAGLSRLALWECRSDGEEAAGEGRSMAASGLAEGGYGFCAEAASLLLREDIPSSLTRLESPLARAERLVREELASIESRLAVETQGSASVPIGHHGVGTPGQYELARSRLQVQRRILSSLNGRGRFAGLLADVDAQLERVTHLELQKEQLDLQRICAGLVVGVEQFCRLTDLCRAQREYDELAGKLQHVRSDLEPQTGEEVTALLDELAGRLDHHLHRLKRLEIRKGIRGPLRHLRRDWPTDWAAPVPESVYRALAQCHLGDPQGAVEDWVALEDQLDAHQGQYHIHRALAVLRAGQVSWDEVQEDFAKALVFDPDLWLAVAPLFGLFCPSGRTQDPAASRPETGVQLAIHATTGHLFDGASGDANDAGPMHWAGRLLERVLEQMTGRTTRCMQLWRRVAATLSPVLERGDLDAIARIRTLAEMCLDRWPIPAAELLGRMDPRNPVSLFLESCEKAQRLAEAGQWLDARPPRWQEAKGCYGEVLNLGLETRDQLRRAATGFYLAAHHEEDTPHLQRQVLTGLEIWVDGMSDEARRQVRESHVVQEIGRLRNDSKGGGHDPQEEGM